MEFVIDQFDRATRSRIEYIQKHRFWIDCPQSMRVIEIAIAISECSPTLTAPAMMVCGDPGSGKSAIVHQLMKINESRGSPFTFISVVENPNGLSFKQVILESFGISAKLAESRGPLSQDVANYIHSRGIRVLVIDEFHGILSGGKNQQLSNLSLLRGLSAAPFNLSVIAFGIPSAKNALDFDAQLSRRYHLEVLKPWKLDEDFRNFLATYEDVLHLKKPSALYQEDLVKLIFYHSNGVMANVVRILDGAALLAIATGEECIGKALIEKSAANPWAFCERR